LGYRRMLGVWAYYREGFPCVGRKLGVEGREEKRDRLPEGRGGQACRVFRSGTVPLLLSCLGVLAFTVLTEW
jgi:hypothetical protein